jgi:hypothetical protein
MFGYSEETEWPRVMHDRLDKRWTPAKLLAELGFVVCSLDVARTVCYFVIRPYPGIYLKCQTVSWSHLGSPGVAWSSASLAHPTSATSLRSRFLVSGVSVRNLNRRTQLSESRHHTTCGSVSGIAHAPVLTMAYRPTGDLGAWNQEYII